MNKWYFEISATYMWYEMICDFCWVPSWLLLIHCDLLPMFIVEGNADFIERLWKLRCNFVCHPSLALWIQSTLFIDLCPKRMVHKWKLHIYFYMCSRQCSFLGKRTLFLWSSQRILISKDLVTNVGVKTFLFLYLSSWMMVYRWFVLNKSIR